MSAPDTTYQLVSYVPGVLLSDVPRIYMSLRQRFVVPCRNIIRQFFSSLDQ